MLKASCESNLLDFSKLIVLRILNIHALSNHVHNLGRRECISEKKETLFNTAFSQFSR